MIYPTIDITATDRACVCVRAHHSAVEIALDHNFQLSKNCEYIFLQKSRKKRRKQQIEEKKVRRKREKKEK
jgi:hypothetical protein